MAMTNHTISEDKVSFKNKPQQHGQFWFDEDLL